MSPRAIVFPAPGQVELRTVELPEPGPDQILCETLYSLISPGTETRVLAGKEANCFPLVPGYANVGRVIARGAHVELPLGTIVSVGNTEACSINRLWGGHISHTIKTAASARPLPPGLDPLHGALVTVAAISHRGVMVAPAAPGELVVVVGLGAIGLLAALIHKLRGARVIAFNRSAGRVARARALGLDAHTFTGSLSETFAKMCPEGADIVVDATGSVAVLDETLRLGKSPPWGVNYDRRPRFVMLGSYGEPVSFNYQHAFLREYEIHVPRLSRPEDLDACTELIASGQLPAADIIAGPYAPEEAPDVFRRISQSHDDLVTAAFRWTR